MYLPWIAGLVPLANRPTMLESTNNALYVTLWFIDPSRISLFLRAQVYYMIGGPVVKFMFILGIKRTLDLLCGRSVPEPAKNQFRKQILRSAVLSQILPDGHLLWFTELLGVHYELVSVALRALGARIGKRVYWPALGPLTQDYDLVEIGDDILWGAQSHLNTSDGYGKGKVVIEDGAMVADRAVISPGASIGERVQVGSGALLKRDKHYSADSVLIGSRKGEAVHSPSPVVKKKDVDGLSDLPFRPFGRAFYLGLAKYRVWTEL
jgi:acetyltransferase-like isoleucine patch superfamily enzyme